MVEGLFALGGVILGGIITALTSYLLHKSEVKNKKQERIELKQEELYIEIQKHLNDIIIKGPYSEKLLIDDYIVSKLMLFAKKEIYDLFIEINSISVELKKKPQNIREKEFNNLIKKCFELSDIIKKELGTSELKN